jgi:hypothetical protein
LGNARVAIFARHFACDATAWSRFSGQSGPFFDNSADFKAMLSAFSCFWASGIGHTLGCGFSETLLRRLEP